jgi:hypothetical protein
MPLHTSLLTKSELNSAVLNAKAKPKKMKGPPQKQNVRLTLLLQRYIHSFTRKYLLSIICSVLVPAHLVRKNKKNRTPPNATKDSERTIVNKHKKLFHKQVAFPFRSGSSRLHIARGIKYNKNEKGRDPRWKEWSVVNAYISWVCLSLNVLCLL